MAKRAAHNTSSGQLEAALGRVDVLTYDGGRVSHDCRGDDGRRTSPGSERVQFERQWRCGPGNELCLGEARAYRKGSQRLWNCDGSRFAEPALIFKESVLRRILLCSMNISPSIKSTRRSCTDLWALCIFTSKVRGLSHDHCIRMTIALQSRNVECPNKSLGKSCVHVGAFFK